MPFSKLTKHRLRTVVLWVLVSCLLCSCVETVSVGVLSSATILTRNKSLENTKDDVIIATKLGSRFLENGLKNIGNSVDITVSEQRVMLTGIVRDPKKARLAHDLAWKIEGVKEVIDEIIIFDGEKLSPKDFANATNDYYLSARVESALLITKNVSSVNYKVTTVDKNVYLLGSVKTKKDLDAALASVSKINGVEKVINHVKIIENHNNKSDSE